MGLPSWPDIERVAGQLYNDGLNQQELIGLLLGIVCGLIIVFGPDVNKIKLDDEEEEEPVAKTTAKSAMSQPVKSKLSRSLVFRVLSPNETSVPSDLRLANATISSTGKARSAKIFSIS